MYNMILERETGFVWYRDENTKLIDIPKLSPMPLEEVGRKSSLPAPQDSAFTSRTPSLILSFREEEIQTEPKREVRH